MKTAILNRVKALGGNVEGVAGKSLQQDLEAIQLKTPLYPKPVDTPWAAAQEVEPIIGLEDYIEEHRLLFESDRNRFFEQLLDDYFDEGKEIAPCGQSYYQPKLFTPFKTGTADFEEWQGIIREAVVREAVHAERPDFVQILSSYGYPDAYYISLSDKNPDNPMVYGTDHEVFFEDLEMYGSLETFLQSFFTKGELRTLLETALTKTE